MDLTIAIPTFNRPKGLINLINKIAASGFLDNNKLEIFDNNSLTEVNLSEYERFFNSGNLVYHRRIVNIGPIANILRIFEEAKTEWLIIIGDDDDISNDFNFVLEKTIRSINSSVIGIKFGSNLNDVDQDTTIKNLEGFIEANKNRAYFSSTLLISTWVYRREKILPFLRLCYLHAGTQLLPILPIIFSLKEGAGYVRYIPERPIIYSNLDRDGVRWSPGITFTMMVVGIITLPIFKSTNELRSLVKSMVGSDIYGAVGFSLRYLYSFPDGNSKLISALMSKIGFRFYLGYRIAVIIKVIVDNIKFLKKSIKYYIGPIDSERL